MNFKRDAKFFDNVDPVKLKIKEEIRAIKQGRVKDWNGSTTQLVYSTRPDNSELMQQIKNGIFTMKTHTYRPNKI